MTLDQFISLLKGISELVGVLVWPLIILVVVLRFRSQIGEILGSLTELSLKAAGIEATVKRQQVKAAAALGAAVAKHSGIDIAPDAGTVGADDVAGMVTESVTARTVKRLSNIKIIWVDDNPDNNIFERRSLEALGIRFTISRSTDDAFEKLEEERFDVIISDMGRPPDSRAGYTLLDTLRGKKDKTPFIIYAGSNAPEHKKEAKRHGAQGSTNHPYELFELVLKAVGVRADAVT